MWSLRGVGQRGQAGVLLALASLMLIGAGVVARQPTATAPSVPLSTVSTLLQGQGWVVQAATIDGQMAVGGIFTTYDQTTVLDYAPAVQSMAPDIFARYDRIPALVTFRHPVPLAAFPRLMADADVRVVSVRIRTIGPDGQRGRSVGSRNLMERSTSSALQPSPGTRGTPLAGRLRYWASSTPK